MASIQRTGTPRGGQVLTQHRSPASTTNGPAQAVLHLRGATREREDVECDTDSADGRSGRRIQWAEDVIDNEGLGRKSSKVCCIYHGPRGIDDSSDESSSDSDDSDSGDDGAARPAGGRREGPGLGHGHNHKHNHDHTKGNGNGKGRASSPNAYEKVPKPKNGSTKDKR